MLAISGLDAGTQQLSIQDVDSVFPSFLNNYNSPSQQFTVLNNSCAVYDLDHNGVSDVDYALQSPPGPVMLEGGLVPPAYPLSGSDGQDDRFAARTAIGLGPGVVYFVVADGEGVHGGCGSTNHNLGLFFRDQLHAISAMKLDGGQSSELVLRGSTLGGIRHVNTITSENSVLDTDPFNSPIQIKEESGSYGSVGNVISAGQ